MKWWFINQSIKRAQIAFQLMSWCCSTNLGVVVGIDCLFLLSRETSRIVGNFEAQKRHFDRIWPLLIFSRIRRDSVKRSMLWFVSHQGPKVEKVSVTGFSAHADLCLNTCSQHSLLRVNFSNCHWYRVTEVEWSFFFLFSSNDSPLVDMKFDIVSLSSKLFKFEKIKKNDFRPNGP